MTAHEGRPRGLHPYPGMERDRLAALVTGLVGAVLALLAGFLPVHQDTARVDWTAGSDFRPVTAPLVSGRPLDITLDIPCRAAAAAPDGTILLSTLPGDAPDLYSAGLVVQRARAADGTPGVDVVVRNITLLTVPVSALRDPACGSLHVRGETGVLVAEATGLPDDEDHPVRAAMPGQMRPQVVGVFTGVRPGDAPAGLDAMHASVTVDARYSSSPTAIKVVLMVVGVLCTLASLLYLHRLDGLDGRRDRRFVPSEWTRLAPVDWVVGAVLGLWHVIGANTSDDGYLLTMARAAGPSGYMANYYRWLGSPESPVGWYYEILRAFTEVSTASPWMRLPTLLCGILSWLIISREVVPRLGRLARTWYRPQWTGAAVFLAFWMAFDNGLRPEPVIALGALLTWSLVERSIATRRLVPGVVAVGVAAFSVGTGPTGLMCVAALAAGSRDFIATMRRRAAVVGWGPVLAPLFAVGLSLLYTVFVDQTLASVLEATGIRTQLGPSLPWYGEKDRWIALFGVSADGGVARRFPVLLMLLCVAVVGAVMLRRGRIPGAAVGPSRRLLGVIVGSLALLVFTPTKWTHHFGVFAGLAGALAVLTVIALRSHSVALVRNRWLVAAGLCVVVGVATATDNTWWYVSDYGIPFSSSFPAIGGLQINYVAFLSSIACVLVAGLIHVGLLPERLPPRVARALARVLPMRMRPLPDTPAARAARLRLGASPRYRPRRGISPSPLTVVAFSVVLFELASAFVAVLDQSPAYTVGRSNTRALMGEPCALADAVLVEEDSNDGVLTPVGAADDVALGAGGSSGFAPNGLPDDISVPDAENEDSSAGQAGGKKSSGSSDGVDAGTTGGRGAVTVNGSTVKLPFGLDPATTSVLGSYRRGPQVAASLTSSWYELPARTANRPLLVMAAAGQVGPGDVTVEYGRPGRVGAAGPSDFEVLGEVTPVDIGPAPAWRNLRIPLDQIPADAEVVRIRARDINLSPDWWVAVTPPRNPRLRTLDQVVGHTDPVLIDWVVGLAFPCQRPFTHLDGVAEPPRYRILADRKSSSAANWWQGADGGGPLLWIDQTLQAETVPTYLDHDWSRDWGSLVRYRPLEPRAVPATVHRGSELRWGMSSPGPMN